MDVSLLTPDTRLSQGSVSPPLFSLGLRTGICFGFSVATEHKEVFFYTSKNLSDGIFILTAVLKAASGLACP